MGRGPTKAELLRRLEEMEASFLPRYLETINDPRNEPTSQLSGLTADRLHQAITSAEQGDTRLLFSVYRDVLSADTHVQGVIETRFLAVIGDDPMIAPVDPQKPEDKAAADAIRSAVDRLPDFLGVCADLLWGTIWPISMIERTYKPADIPGLRFDWGDISPVPDHLFRWTEGFLQVEELDPATSRPSGKFCRPDPARYIIHRGHLLRTPDTWGGPMRALTWWFLLKIMDREWWARFLDKFGTPFISAAYDKSDDRGRQILERALKLSTRIGGIAVSSGTRIELMQANTSAADAHEKFFRMCNDEISRRVLGQTLSSTSAPTGIGGGASDIQGQVRSDIAGFDKKMLAQTIRNHLFKPWLRINGFSGAVPTLTFGGEEQEENSTTAEVLSKLKTAGLRIADKSLAPLSLRIGLEIERDPEGLNNEAVPIGGLNIPGELAADQAAANGKIGATAMNGAQVASLVQVIGQVAARELPAGAAMEVLKNAFPIIPESSLRSMLDEASKQSAPSPAMLPLSAPLPRSSDPIAASERISRDAAASIMQAYRGSLAPVAQIILASATAEEAQVKLLSAYSSWDATKVAEIVESAITAGAWNGLQN